jgi:hypothetical protein
MPTWAVVPGESKGEELCPLQVTQASYSVCQPSFNIHSTSTPVLWILLTDTHSGFFNLLNEHQPLKDTN